MKIVETKCPIHDDATPGSIYNVHVIVFLKVYSNSLMKFTPKKASEIIGLTSLCCAPAIFLSVSEEKKN
jgi:hypothetical protein